MTKVERKIWRDGEFVDWADATVHVLAQSLQRGSLAFDYMSVHDTPRGPAIMKLDEHIARLFATCELMGIPIGYTPDELIAACIETVVNNPGSHSVKISALIPSIEVELVPQDATVAVFIAAYDSQADIIDRNVGKYHAAKVVSLKIAREISNRRADIIPPQAKVAANYTSGMFSKWRARKAGYDDILLLDENDLVAESTTSNLFAVIDGGLVTPPGDRVLHGVTRQSILELAPALGIGATERDLTVTELFGADEVFLTATSVGVWPVVKIDDQVFSNGEIGAVTRRLRDKHRLVSSGEDPDFDAWLTYCS